MYFHPLLFFSYEPHSLFLYLVVLPRVVHLEESHGCRHPLLLPPVATVGGGDDGAGVQEGPAAVREIVVAEGNLEDEIQNDVIRCKKWAK